MTGAWEKVLDWINYPNLHNSVEARNGVDSGRLGDEFALDLVPHSLDGVCVRTNEGDALGCLFKEIKHLVTSNKTIVSFKS